MDNDDTLEAVHKLAQAVQNLIEAQAINEEGRDPYLSLVRARDDAQDVIDIIKNSRPMQ